MVKATSPFLNRPLRSLAQAEKDRLAARGGVPCRCCDDAIPPSKASIFDQTIPCMTGSKPRALDLFCGAGGASMGLYRAGFDVVGIDVKPQPRYPFTFIQADALRPPVRLADFDFVWASPPCQHASVGSRRWKAAGRKYPDLIAATRALLAGHPLTCIENVPGAAIRADLVLTGAIFGLPTYRRRHFELSFPAFAPAPGRPFGPKTRPGSFTAAGNGGHGPNRPRLWAAGMGVEWMADKREIAQAIPPAYSEFIGRAALQYLRQAA